MFGMIEDMSKIATVFTDMIRQGLTSYLRGSFRAEFRIGLYTMGGKPSWRIEAAGAGPFWSACLQQALDFHNYSPWEAYRTNPTGVSQYVIVCTADKVTARNPLNHYFIIEDSTGNVTYIQPSVEWIKVICASLGFTKRG